MKNINHNASGSEADEYGKPTVRPEFGCNLLVSAIVQVTQGIAADKSGDPVQQLIDGAFGEFAHCKVIDSFYDHGVQSTAANGWKPVRAESLTVVAKVWVKPQITVPFYSTGKLSLSQQRFIHRNAVELLFGIIDAEYEAQVSDANVWWEDADGNPTIFLTGRLDLIEGRLTERKLRRVAANAWASIPSDMRGADQAE